jgi:hypothetical protein
VKLSGNDIVVDFEMRILNEFTISPAYIAGLTSAGCIFNADSEFKRVPLLSGFIFVEDITSIEKPKIAAIATKACFTATCWDEATTHDEHRRFR